MLCYFLIAQVLDKRVCISANLYQPPPYSALCTVTEKWNFAAVLRRINRELCDFFWLHRNQRVFFYRFHTKPCMFGNFLKTHRDPSTYILEKNCDFSSSSFVKIVIKLKMHLCRALKIELNDVYDYIILASCGVDCKVTIPEAGPGPGVHHEVPHIMQSALSVWAYRLLLINNIQITISFLMKASLLHQSQHSPGDKNWTGCENPRHSPPAAKGSFPGSQSNTS